MAYCIDPRKARVAIVWTWLCALARGGGRGGVWAGHGFLGFCEDGGLPISQMSTIWVSQRELHGAHFIKARRGSTNLEILGGIRGCVGLSVSDMMEDDAMIHVIGSRRSAFVTGKLFISSCVCCFSQYKVRNGGETRTDSVATMLLPGAPPHLEEEAKVFRH